MEKIYKIYDFKDEKEWLSGRMKDADGITEQSIRGTDVTFVIV